MKLKGILPFARELLATVVGEGDTAVDATAGNGHDSCYLAKLVGDTGKVYSFDVQAVAIEATQSRIQNEGLSNRVSLHQIGHEQAADIIPQADHSSLKAAIFNLGYLPGSDKQVTTQANTSITAIKGLLNIMPPGGLIVLVIYHGHPEGALEKEELLTYVQQLPQDHAHVLQYGFVNQKNTPPFIIAIEKR